MVDLCNYVPLLGQPFRWNNQADRLSYGFQCRVSEQQPGGQIKSPQPILAVRNINNGRHVLEWCAQYLESVRRRIPNIIRTFKNIDEGVTGITMSADGGQLSAAMVC